MKRINWSIISPILIGDKCMGSFSSIKIFLDSRSSHTKYPNRNNIKNMLISLGKKKLTEKI